MFLQMFIHNFLFGVINTFCVEGQGIYLYLVLKRSFEAEVHQHDNFTFMFWAYSMMTLVYKVGWCITNDVQMLKGGLNNMHLHRLTYLFVVIWP